MFTPNIGSPCFFQLNDNDPCKAQINHHVERNYFNITIFQKDGSVYDNRDVNLSDGTCKFF